MTSEGATESWFVRARGRVQGPLTWAQLLALRERGQLARFDQISRDGQTWTGADTVDGVFPRGGAAGAFVGAGRSKGEDRKRVPESESVGFLILDDEPAGSVPAARAGASAAPIEEPVGWYYADAGQPQGPVALSELKSLAKNGRIGPGTLYWRSGLDQWTTGSGIADLNHLWRQDADSGPAAGGVNLPPRGRDANPDRPATAPRVNPLATISVALNLFCGVGNLAAIVVGVVAIRQIAHSKGTMTGNGMAIFGIALGVAGLAITAVASFWFLKKGSG